MSNLSVRSETFLPAEDQTWLGSAHGTQEGDTITLDAALFPVGTWADGIVKSGTVLGRVTATGLYGPYGQNASEVQTLTIDATGGTFTLTFDGETTAAIAEAATGATVQAALEALSNIEPGDVAVTGVAGGPHTITFGGRYLGENVPTITTDATSLTGGAGTAVIAVTTAGGSAVADGREVARGHLLTTKDVTGATKVGASLYWHGEVVEANLPANNKLDAAAKAQLSQIRYV